MSALVDINELKAVTGYKQASDVEKCLRKDGVRFLYGKAGIYTTIDALNAAMGLQSGKLDYTEAEIDIL